jgi:antitoxin ParD1/3/4
MQGPGPAVNWAFSARRLIALPIFGKNGAMGKNTSISLSDHNLDFVHQQMESGRFGSTSEVIRDALRLMEERELKLATLKRELQKGLDSGPSRPFDWDGFMERKFRSDDGV